MGLCLKDTAGTVSRSLRGHTTPRMHPSSCQKQVNYHSCRSRTLQTDAHSHFETFVILWVFVIICFLADFPVISTARSFVLFLLLLENLKNFFYKTYKYAFLYFSGFFSLANVTVIIYSQPSSFYFHLCMKMNGKSSKASWLFMILSTPRVRSV